MLRPKCPKCGTEINQINARLRTWFWVTVLAIGIFSLILYLLAQYGTKLPHKSDYKRDNPIGVDTVKDIPPDIRKAFDFEVIRIEKRNEDDPQYANVQVAIMFTNISNKIIKQAVVTCVLQDANGKNVAVLEDIVVWYDESPLMPGESRHHIFKEYLFPLNMVSAKCNAKTIEWYKN